MKNWLRAGVVVILVLVVVVTGPAKQGKLNNRHLFSLVNTYRSEQGLSKMVWWYSLCRYADQRAHEIVTTWGHSGFKDDEVVTEGYVYGRICPECVYAGENLAKDYQSDEAILEAWLASPTHKEILDKPEWDIGCVAVVDDNFVSMEFGKKRIGLFWNLPIHLW